MKAICNRSLFSDRGEENFTLGKTYEVGHYVGDAIYQLFNNKGDRHHLDPNGWGKHFTLLKEIDFLYEIY